VAHGSRRGDRGASGPAGWASLGAAGTIAARQPVSWIPNLMINTVAGAAALPNNSYSI
jgi:hypothetical protein